MQELRASGLTYRAVADKMNSEGLPTRSRGRWHPQTVQRILAAQSLSQGTAQRAAQAFSAQV
jgi:hypothetical protein